MNLNQMNFGDNNNWTANNTNSDTHPQQMSYPVLLPNVSQQPQQQPLNYPMSTHPHIMPPSHSPFNFIPPLFQQNVSQQPSQQHTFD